MKKLLFTLLTAALILTGCDKSRTDSSVNNGPGRLSVAITDDPFNINFVESATVTITKIEVRKAGDDTGNPFMVVSEDPVTVDLINLRNGITEELANVEVPNGDYDLVRLYVDEAGLKLKENAGDFTVKVPSGKQTGIKVFVSPVIHVEGGLTAELVLDFDLSKSFVMRGNLHHMAGVNGFIFKPCIRAINKTVAGRIEGFVRDTSQNVIADAAVWVKQDTVYATTFTDTDGHYLLAGVPAGAYTLLASQDGYDTVSVEGIEVIAGNRVTHDFELTYLLHYVGSVIENTAADKLVITFSDALNGTVVPDKSAFAVEVEGAGADIASLEISGNTVILNLTAPVANGNNVTVAYTRPETNPLQNEAGLEFPSFDAQTVTNNVAK